jgi:hypothetical protein
MDDKRRLEVLTILVRENLGREFHLVPPKDFQRELLHKAKQLGATPEEILEITEPLVREIVGEMFSSPTSKKQGIGFGE